MRHDTLRPHLLPSLLLLCLLLALPGKGRADATLAQGHADAIQTQGRADATLAETFYPIEGSPARGRVTDFHMDDYGFLWIATWDGLVRFDGYTMRAFKSYTGDSVRLDSHRLQRLYPAEGGDIWCETFDGSLYRFDTHRYRFVRPSAEVTDTVRPHLDRPGRRRARAYRRQLLERPQPLVAQHSPFSGELTPVRAELQCIYLDAQGNFWSNCQEAGFSRLSQSRHSFDFIDHGRNVEVRALCLDHRNRLWAASRYTRFDRQCFIALYDSATQCIGYLNALGQVRPTRQGPGQPGLQGLGQPGLQAQQEETFPASIYCIHEDHLGRIWMGSRHQGLYVLTPRDADGGSYQVRHYTDGSEKGQLQGNSVYDITEDGEGHLWIATFEGGLNLVSDATDAARLTFSNARHGLEQYPGGQAIRCRDLLVTSRGELLIATDGGLLSCPTHFDSPGDITFHRNESSDRQGSLAVNSLMNLCELPDGRILVSTNGGGLNILQRPATCLTDSLTFGYRDSRQEGMSDIIYASSPMPDGNILVQSENSLVLFDDSLLHHRLMMHGVGTSETPPIALPDGQVWMATRHDLLHFAPPTDSAQRSTFVPHVVFTAVNVLIADSLHSHLLSPIDSLVLLSTAERDVRIAFSALDLSDPRRIQYRYRLDGHDDDDWTDLGFSHELHLPKLNPGTHRLEVCSTNADRVWCPNAARLTLAVEPRIHERHWFWIIILGLILLLVLLQHKHWRRMLTRHNQERQAAIDAVRQQADEQLQSARREADEQLQNARREADEQLQNARREADERLQNAEREADARLQEALHRATSQVMKQMMKHDAGTGEQEPLNQDDLRFRQSVIRYITDRIKDPNLKVDDLAQLHNMSRPVFYRRIKQLFGCSPIELVKTLRIRHATELLSHNSHISVSEVAYLCGFSSPQYFNRVFRESVNCSPSEFKNQMHEEEEA